MRTRIAWALVGILTWTGGCGQLLGLGDYIDAPDGGSAVSRVDIAVDAPVADGVPPPSADAVSEALSVSDSSVPEVQGVADAATDFPLDSNSDGGSAGDTYAGEAQISDSSGDASMDADFDALASDAAGDAVAPCPAICNAGCGGGATCLITVTSSAAGPVNCPPGLACQVHCLGTQVCGTSINCAQGQPCKVTCDGTEACMSNTINQGGAISLCVECLGGGKGGCNSVSCSATACLLFCNGKCGGSCGNCTPVFSYCP